MIGKARLAPLKPLTVPRMELSAAVLATKLDRMVKQELSIPLTDESVFWTDSTCVLGYVENECKRFHTFVANRIAAIHDSTLPSMWRYVNTASNPADEASRGLPVTESLDNVRWIQGPPFLWQQETSWPKRPTDAIRIQENDPELKREVTACATTVKPLDLTVSKIFQRFSSWIRLKKFVAWMLRLKRNLRRSKGSEAEKKTRKVIDPLTVDEMRNAEYEILKHVQSEHFSDELSSITDAKDSASSKQTNVKKSSCIYKLDPMLSGGLLRVGGRLKNADIDFHAKHPAILPKQHHVATLIVRHYHEASGHSGTEHMLSLIRETFWIIDARTLIRRINHNCVTCKKKQGPVEGQKMADLPSDRVTANKPPFTFVGVDCFGPFNVRRGRSQVKRYGVLFTCLTTRAIHIEVAHSLDTDSFINSLRRFIARRGNPEEMRSDNGTNFVSGEKELRKSVAAWNQQQIHQFLLQKNVKWTFNPPAGSHHGGIWERCIRTVRKVMNGLMKEQTLDDEGLATLMCEVESIVNSRPITKSSDDPKDLEALTPNHLLLLRGCPNNAPGVFDSADGYSRRRWRQVQYLANIFWRRWVKEYLPSLQARQKWCKKRRNLAVDDIILVVDDTLPRGSWPLGRVIEVCPNSKDGLVRRVVVKTKTSTLTRPVDKLVLLEAAEE